MNYQDFRLWLGDTISAHDAMIFRHDSDQNVPFQALVRKKNSQPVQSNRSADEMYKELVNKIEKKWFNVYKAFSGLTYLNQGSISPQELLSQMTKWGMDIS